MSVVRVTSPVTHFSSPPDEPLPRDPEGGLEEPEETMELEEMEKRPEGSDEILDKFLDGIGSLEHARCALNQHRRCTRTS